MDEQLIRRVMRMEDDVDRLKTLEFAGINDPIYALSKSVDWIRTRVGSRAIWSNWNVNDVPNGLFAWSLSNNPNPFVDSTRHYPYWRAKITGTEYLRSEGQSTLWTVDSAVHNWNPNPGLTVGSWVRHKSYHAVSSGVLACWNANTSQRSWRLMNIETPMVVSGNDRPRFDLSTNGTGTANQIELAVTPALDTWVLYVGRWTPSTETKIWLYEDGAATTDTNTTSIMGTLHRPTLANTDAYWGNFISSGGTEAVADADLALGFFVVTALTDAEIQTFYNISRRIFGV